MSANMAPALVRTRDDLVEYRVEDAQPAHEGARRGFLERYIHSEIYKRFPEVQSVVHAHAHQVLPYAISGVPFLPCGHMAGFLGSKVPVYDIEEYYKPQDSHDLLVSSIQLGASLAKLFSSSEAQPRFPEHEFVLMRRHGFTTVGRNIKDAVYHAVYAIQNANTLTTSLLVRVGFAQLQAGSDASNRAEVLHDMEGLTNVQTRDCERNVRGGIARPWGLWVQEVKTLPLYTSKVE
ncbi:hypothetical protein B0A52_09718 [Exophiala mesophila]|uniref:Class II aldolase/adducin N-terminal domain-containing protein n=1 Tax=Exophiala mesophila TaxID=212818 RepID=A0A438MRJ8_EXOME|nr:hypothetical protein B0A52_09718 [Exophiala mesophila]